MHLQSEWQHSALPLGLAARGHFPLQALDFKLLRHALHHLPVKMQSQQQRALASQSILTALNHFMAERAYSAPLTNFGRLIKEPRQRSFTAMPYAIDEGYKAILVVPTAYERWFASTNGAHQLSATLRSLNLATQTIDVDGYGYDMWVIPWADFPPAKATSWAKKFTGIRRSPGP